MSQKQQSIGLAALGVIVIALAFAIWHEDTRRLDAATRLQAEAIEQATVTYAENCVICHGASGEGIGPVPALASDALRVAADDGVSKVIARGRYTTNMGAWAVSEGGILYNHEIDALVTLIRYADWAEVRAYVQAAGLMPPEAVVAEVGPDLLAQVAALPNGQALAAGLTLYAENCTACHNANGEGSTLAPALNTPDFRAQRTDEQIRRTITQGTSGTLMAAWDRALTSEEIDSLVVLLREWDTLNQAGIALPVTAAQPETPTSPEMIAEGQQLFGLLCKQCHGTSGQGTQLGPALNTQNLLNNTPDAAIRQIIAMGVDGTMMPAWGGRLTDADINAITAYLRSWESTAPPVAQP
jgi:cbb3-type cytochrome c oxidase subunit III